MDRCTVASFTTSLQELKMKKIITSLALAGCFALTATAAHATDGSINFIGQLVDTTCTVSVNGGTENGTVTLPTLPASALTTNGETGGDTNFTIRLTACSKDGVSIISDFGPAPQINSAGRLTNMLGAGGALNVELEVLDAVTDLPIKLGDPSQLNATPAIVTGGIGTLPYTVRYYATAQTEPGPVQSMVTFLLAYL
jgi:major type 1 subunit fimbrin (pilin)